MAFDEKALRRPLSIEEIDFRVQSINNGKYAIILAYKDARCDMVRLDEACGPLGWKREHTRENHNCIVSIWDEKNKQWVSKEDTGTEGQGSGDAITKGLASDSFKRACFNFGIGRELYDYPLIQIKLQDNEVKETGQQKPKYRASFDLKIKEWTWFSEFNEDGTLKALGCRDTAGKVRYTWGDFTRKPKDDEKEKVQEQKETTTQETGGEAPKEKEEKKVQEEKAIDKAVEAAEQAGYEVLPKTDLQERYKELYGEDAKKSWNKGTLIAKIQEKEYEDSRDGTVATVEGAKEIIAEYKTRSQVMTDGKELVTYCEVNGMSTADLALVKKAVNDKYLELPKDS